MGTTFEKKEKEKEERREKREGKKGRGEKKEEFSDGSLFGACRRSSFEVKL